MHFRLLKKHVPWICQWLTNQEKICILHNFTLPIPIYPLIATPSWFRVTISNCDYSQIVIDCDEKKNAIHPGFHPPKAANKHFCLYNEAAIRINLSFTSSFICLTSNQIYCNNHILQLQSSIIISSIKKTRDKYQPLLEWKHALENKNERVETHCKVEVGRWWARWSKMCHLQGWFWGNMQHRNMQVPRRRLSSHTRRMQASVPSPLHQQMASIARRKSSGESLSSLSPSVVY